MKTIYTTEYKILQHGDKVISVSEHEIAIQHSNGEVSIFSFNNETSGREIINETLISYEELEPDTDNIQEKGIEIIHF